MRLGCMSSEEGVTSDKQLTEANERLSERREREHVGLPRSTNERTPLAHSLAQQRSFSSDFRSSRHATPTSTSRLGAVYTTNLAGSK